MNQTAEAQRASLAPIEIRYTQVGMAQARIRTTDPGAILDELTGRVAAAPHFFERTAVCIDLSALEQLPEVTELKGVIDAVRRAGMMAVALANGSPGIEDLARALDFPLMSAFRAQAKPAPVVQAVEATPVAQPTLMHNLPVRSGQKIYARQRDLIATATVGAGAELMADGSVHIYGSMRGRVMAGVRGDTTARVFCQEFNPELVSIAGVFRVFETLPSELAGKPVQAWLDGENLRFALLGGA
jgi:septum site-determining protein MinC